MISAILIELSKTANTHLGSIVAPLPLWSCCKLTSERGEKNKKGESILYTLADIKTRADASFAKDYMAGKYGAIPVLSAENDIYAEMVGEWLCQD